MKKTAPFLTPLSCRTSRGEHSALPQLTLIGLVLLTVLEISALAALITKADNPDALNLGSSWVGGTAPGAADIAQWDNTVSAANTTNTLGADLAWLGLAILNPGAPVTLNAGNKLTLGNPNDATTPYDVVSVTSGADLILNCDVELSTGQNNTQQWYVVSSRTLTVNGLVTGAPPYGLHKRGSGTLVLNNDNNNYAGVTDCRDGIVIATSLADIGVPCSLGAPTNGTYATIGIGANIGPASTTGIFRYKGTNPAGHSSNRKFEMYGTTTGGVIDASGVGPLMLSGGITGGVQGSPYIKTVTLKGTNTSGDNTESGTITQGNGSHPTAVLKDGVCTWKLSGVNTFTGDLTILNGTLVVANNLATGSYPSTTMLGNSEGAGGLLLSLLIDGPNSATRPITVWTGLSRVTLGSRTAHRSSFASNIVLGKSVNVTNVSGGTVTFAGPISETIPSALTIVGAGTVVLSATNSYTHGTIVGAGTLEIAATGSIFGTVLVTNGAVLQLDHSTALAAAATMTLEASPSANTVNLNFTGTQSISALYFGTTQQASGTWGAVGSGAVNTNAAFTGSGLLNIPGAVPCSQTNVALSVSNRLDGTITLTFRGTPGAYYYVLGSTEATNSMSGWVPLSYSTNQAASPSGLWSCTVTNTVPRKFYRGAAVLPCL